MKRLPKDFELDRYGLHVRLAQVEDSPFILSLRTDEKLSRFIHVTDNNLGKQIAWMHEYKKREEKGIEYYFIFEQTDNPLGVCRIYDIREKEYTVGSWVFSKSAPMGSAILADIITREIAFDLMPEKRLKFDVSRENTNVLRYQRTFHPTVVKEDTDNIHFEITKDVFDKYKSYYLKIFKRLV